MPGGQIGSWGDGLWCAKPTLTTVGNGDHVPVTLAGRLPETWAASQGGHTVAIPLQRLTGRVLGP